MPRALLKERPYRAGMPFDPDAFKNLICNRSYPFALEKAVSLLAGRARTEREIAEALQRNAYPEPVIAQVMQRLTEAGYIDDADFAQQWVSARAAKGMGIRRIQFELRRKGVQQERIDQAVSSIDHSTVLNSAFSAAQKAARGKDVTSPADRQKILAALSRRGFDFSTAKQAIQMLIES